MWRMPALATGGAPSLEAQFLVGARFVEFGMSKAVCRKRPVVWNRCKYTASHFAAFVLELVF
jgi:hypothetical protein